jgi:predicted GNAT family acetyltransferase
VYFGIRDDRRIVSAAGTHLVSARLGVAALGNVVTLPAYRGRGYCKIVTAATCAALRPAIADIGLNVRADNRPAVRCYEDVGFRGAASYVEVVCERP